MAVSMSVVSHSTKSMNAPNNMPPGIKSLRPARIRIMMRKMMVREDVMIAKVKSLLQHQQYPAAQEATYHGIPSRI